MALYPSPSANQARHQQLNGAAVGFISALLLSWIVMRLGGYHCTKASTAAATPASQPANSTSMDGILASVSSGPAGPAVDPAYLSVDPALAAAHNLAGVRGWLSALGKPTATTGVMRALDPQALVQLSRLEQELFCAHVHPLAMTGITRLTEQVHKLPGLVHYLYGDGDYVSKSITADGTWEPTDMEEMMWALGAHLPPGAHPTSAIAPALMVDIGANIGSFMFRAAALGYEVIGFEAMRSNQLLLRSSLCASAPAVSNRVTLMPYGLGAERTRCHIIADANNRGDGITLCTKPGEKMRDLGTYVVRSAMDILPLDDVVQRDVKLIKMDVEGFEAMVMAGAQKLLKQHTVWFILMEWNQVLLQSAGGQKDPAAFVLQLQELGYSVSTKSFKGPTLPSGPALADELKRAANGSLINLYLVHKRYREWPGAAAANPARSAASSLNAGKSLFDGVLNKKPQ